MPPRPEPTRTRTTGDRGRATPASRTVHARELRFGRGGDEHRLLYLLVGGSLLLIALILGGGWLLDNVVRAGDTVAVVGGESITARQLVDEMRPIAQAIEAQARRAQPAGARSTQVQSQIENQKRTLPDSTLDQLTEARIIALEAAQRGITVTDEQVEAKLREQVAQSEAFRNPQPTATVGAEAEASPTAAPTLDPSVPPPTATPVPTLEPDAFQVALNSQLGEIGIGETYFRELIRRDLLREEVQKAVGAEVSAFQDQVRARHILVPTEEAANDVLARLNAGEDFAALAQELSTDPGSKDKGGDLGWFPRGAMVAPFENAAFELQPGQRSGVVRSPNGYHVIEVLERDPNRAIDPSMLENLKQRRFNDWLASRKTAPDVRLEFSTQERNWTLRQIGVRVA